MSVSYILYDEVRSKSLVNYVSGAERPLFFKRPLISQLLDIPIHVSQPQKSQTKTVSKSQQKQNSQQAFEKYKSVLIQTDYRENDTQTDPYTPKCLIKDNENPEVLDLQNLKWGKGLPCSINELQQIEYNREQRWFEESLPPISDEASFDLRRRLMEDQELRQWKKKESEIEELQKEKLILLEKALIEREREIEEKNHQRLQEIKQAKTETKNRHIAKIQRKKIKIDRKMQKAREQWEQFQLNPSKKRNIIEDYANYASRVYAAIAYEGISLDKIANKFEIQPTQLQKYQPLNALVQSINKKEFTCETSINIELKKISQMYTRREIFHKQELKKAQELIEKSEREKKERLEQENNQNNKFSLKNLKNKIRPTTPTWENDESNNLYTSPLTDLKDYINKKVNIMYQKDQRTSAVILLQKLLRGRATQDIMYQGKKKRMALIEELLTVAQIENLPEDKVEEILVSHHQAQVQNATLEGIQGEVISETLDQLSKELLRINQEKKIKNLVEGAEKLRTDREIIEAGQRQAEETLRGRENYLYQQIISLNQGTVDTYLHTIMTNIVDQSSTRQAIIMAKLRKETVNIPLEKQENIYNNKQTIIKNLVHSFLIPDVQRQKIQLKIKQEEKKFTEAAKKSIEKSVINASKMLQQQ